MARFEIPDGMVVQAFRFALDLTPGQEAGVRRQFGGRRYAYSWAVRTMKADLAAFHATGAEARAPLMMGLRKRWNQAKNIECVDRETGEMWWREVSKEAFADGIGGRRLLELAAIAGREPWGQADGVSAVQEEGA